MKYSFLAILTCIHFIAFAQTTLTLQPGANVGNDASLGSHTNYNTENNNYGTNIYLNSYCIPGATGGQNTNRAVIEFDLSSIPSGATIVSADLTLYGAGYINSTLTGHFGNNTSTLSRITSSWSEMGVTWNTAPTTTSVNQVTMPQSTSASQDYVNNVTAMVQDMINSPSTSFGFYFAMVTENPANPAGLLFYSSDASDSTKWPKLVIVYTTSNSCMQPDPSGGQDASLGSHTSYNTENNNYGSNVYLNSYCIPGTQGGQNTNRALLRFDLSAIPATAVVQSADLYLYATGFINSALPGHFGNNASVIERVTTTWSESSVTWNSAPGTTTTGAASLPQSSSNMQDYITNVTTMTQYMVTNPSQNHGFLFRMVVENPASAAGLLFWSSDHSDPNKRPKLCVTYVDSLDPKSVHEIVLSEVDMQVFPNPSADFVRISTEEFFTSAVISFYSQDGKLVKQMTFTGNSNFFDVPVADLADGTYLIELLADSKKGTAKFLKSE